MVVFRYNIGIIGVGSLGERLLDYLHAKNEAALIVSRRTEQALARLAQTYAGIATTTDNTKVAQEAKVVVISLKPKDIQEASEHFKTYLHGGLVVSLAAGKSLKDLNKMMPGQRIARVMPSLAIGSTTAWYCGTGLTQDDHEALASLFGTVKEVEEKDLAVQTYLACEYGLAARRAGVLVDELAKHTGQQEIGKAMGDLFIALGQELQTGKNPQEIYELVGGEKSETKILGEKETKQDETTRKGVQELIAKLNKTPEASTASSDETTTTA